MKKYLTLTFLSLTCLVSSVSNASTGNNKIKNNLSLELKNYNSKAACTQTRYADVYNSRGQYITTISSTYTVTSDDPSMICGLAGAMAQSAADADAATLGYLYSIETAD